MEAEEKLSSLTGTSVTAYTAENDETKEGTDLEAETWETEKALAEGEGFSSDPLVVTDSLEAVSQGQATVLAGDMVYFVTVE